MDPLSVLASVTGLLAAVGSVLSKLTAIKSTLQDAPRFVDQILSEVGDLKTSLSAMHQLLGRLGSARQGRLALIQIDQLVATLTEAVRTFSDLEIKIASFAISPNLSLVERVKLAWNEDDIILVVERLRRYKLSLSLMLNIVQWYVLDSLIIMSR
jgi:hypothetical protein